ncbi:MAG: AAA family ATPase [Intrasporangium sp.]|uniref:AAA family ATPase n=1 Tax=Intrasporangium sp. TaxID=1925024 RepID=UPI003F808112
MTSVVTALSHRWESAVAAALEPMPDVTVVRRCADVAELMSVTAAGLGESAIVSADLRELDRGGIAALRSRGVWVVGLHAPGDDADERRLRQHSGDVVLPADAAGVVLAAAIRDRRPVSTIGELDGPDQPADVPGDVEAPRGWRPAGLPGGHRPVDDVVDGLPLDEPVSGRVLAVWGPSGAPGRTTIAVTLAAELASRGRPVLLVDADTYGGCIAQVLGLLDEAPGIAAACRAAEHGAFDLVSLARVAPEVTPGLRVLTGLPRADRWPEIRAAALERVLAVSRSLAEYVVIDCGFCLEEDEELSYDTEAPRRNEATLTALAACDEVLVVGGADPVALQRFVRGLQELGTVPSGTPRPVVNRVRASAVGADPRTRIGASLERFAGLNSVHIVPDDPSAADGSLLAGRSVVEHAPDSPLRRAVSDLASAVAPSTARRSTRSSRWRSRRRVDAARG